MIQNRRLQPELMDQPDLNSELHVEALRGLERINVVSRSARILWPAIASVAREYPGAPLRVLDLACGGGDNAVALARLARKADLPVSIAGCDISECALGEARRRAATAGVDEVRFFRMNVLAEPLPDDYDILISSLFLHHLQEAQAVQLLRRMAVAARRAVVICDLERSWLGYGLAWFGCRLLTRSPIVHVDGPRSVEAAFAVGEISSLASRGGLDGAILTHHWPQRWLLSWRKR
jgi:2-polyprenyl-3-methyl-5-hydroxy-6-metoxy-1,4-benzoquinol methylase